MKISIMIEIYKKHGSRRLLREIRIAVRRKISVIIKNPTINPPPGYLKARADSVYKEAFRKCFEYLVLLDIKGEVLEFGTFRGYTARIIATLMREFGYDSTLVLYDSFEGLPEIESVDKGSYEVAVNKVWYKGQMKVKKNVDLLIQKVLKKIIHFSKINIVKGYFEDTLEKNISAQKAALVHIDSDLYSSAKFVLDKLLEREVFQDGTVLLFDDFNSGRANPMMGERRALREAFDGQDRYTCSLFFTYGWHGQAFFVHDKRPINRGV